MMPSKRRQRCDIVWCWHFRNCSCFGRVRLEPVACEYVADVADLPLPEFALKQIKSQVNFPCSIEDLLQVLIMFFSAISPDNDVINYYCTRVVLRILRI